MHETAKIAKDVLEITRKPGGTRNFALYSGYIPDKMEGKFNNLTKNYISVVEDAHVHSVSEGNQELVLPTLLTNKKYIRTFEVITETQGIPRTDEGRPDANYCFCVASFLRINVRRFRSWIAPFGLGMLLIQRGNGSITTWGTLIGLLVGPLCPLLAWVRAKFLAFISSE